MQAYGRPDGRWRARTAMARDSVHDYVRVVLPILTGGGCAHDFIKCE